jgi:hypothetical protein
MIDEVFEKQENFYYLGLDYCYSKDIISKIPIEMTESNEYETTMSFDKKLHMIRVFYRETKIFPNKEIGKLYLVVGPGDSEPYAGFGSVPLIWNRAGWIWFIPDISYDWQSQRLMSGLFSVKEYNEGSH